MRILVTGSAGHLGEALMRVLAELRTRGHRHRRAALAVHRPRGLDRRPRLRALVHARHARRDARRDAAQAARGHARRGRTSSTPTSPARSTCWRRRWRRSVQRLCLHQHDQRLRPRAGAAGRRTGGLDRPRTWCRCPRTSTAPPRWRPKTCASWSSATTACRASCCARRASFPKVTTTIDARAAYRRRQPQGERVSVPPRRHRRRRRRASAGDRAGARRSGSGATSSARPRRSRATTWPSCARDLPPWCAATCRPTRRSTRRLGWSMLPSIDRVYVNESRAPRTGLAPAPRLCRGGGAPAPPATTISAARWRAPSVPRATIAWHLRPDYPSASP